LKVSTIGEDEHSPLTVFITEEAVLALITHLTFQLFSICQGSTLHACS